MGRKCLVCELLTSEQRAEVLSARLRGETWVACAFRGDPDTDSDLIRTTTPI